MSFDAPRVLWAFGIWISCVRATDRARRGVVAHLDELTILAHEDAKRREGAALYALRRVVLGG